MAVPTHHHLSNAPFLTGNYEREVSRMENPHLSNGFGAAFFSNGAVNNGGNPMAGQTSSAQHNPTLDLFSFASQAFPPPPPYPSTHLTLDRIQNAFEQDRGHVQNYQAPPPPKPQPQPQTNHLANAASFLSLSGTHFNQQQQEFIQLLQAQEEHMRNTLMENGRRTFNTLMSAAKDTVERGLKESEKHAKRLTRRNNELQNQVDTMKMESWVLKEKVEEHRKTIAMLQAQILEKEKKEREEGSGESDDGSAFVDPHPEMMPTGVCRECKSKAATVVLIPCRHLCLCSECNEEVAPVPCPICHLIRSGYFQILLA